MFLASLPLPRCQPRRKVARPSSDIKNLVLNMGGRKRIAQQSSSAKDDPLLAELLMSIDEVCRLLVEGVWSQSSLPHLQSTSQQLPKRPKQRCYSVLLLNSCQPLTSLPPSPPSFTPWTPTSVARMVVKQERRERTPSPPHFPSLASHDNGYEDSEVLMSPVPQPASNVGDE